MRLTPSRRPRRTTTEQSPEGSTRDTLVRTTAALSVLNRLRKQLRLNSDCHEAGFPLTSQPGSQTPRAYDASTWNARSASKNRHDGKRPCWPTARKTAQEPSRPDCRGDSRGEPTQRAILTKTGPSGPCHGNSQYKQKCKCRLNKQYRCGGTRISTARARSVFICVHPWSHCHLSPCIGRRRRQAGTCAPIRTLSAHVGHPSADQPSVCAALAECFSNQSDHLVY